MYKKYANVKLVKEIIDKYINVEKYRSVEEVSCTNIRPLFYYNLNYLNGQSSCEKPQELFDMFK